MIKTVTGNYTDLILFHYKMISLLENNGEYTYKGIKLVAKVTDDSVLEYSLNNINDEYEGSDEYTESYRNSEFFNQEPRILEEGQCKSSK